MKISMTFFVQTLPDISIQQSLPATSLLYLGSLLLEYVYCNPTDANETPSCDHLGNTLLLQLYSLIQNYSKGIVHKVQLINTTSF